MTIEQVQLTEERWLDFFRHYRGLPGQRRGLLLLRRQILQADPSLLTEGAEWVEETRRNDPPAQVPPMAELIAQSNGDVANTWEGIEMAARIAGAKFPALVAAQWALESGWGKTPSGRNNFWGLKGKGTAKQTLEEVNGVMRPEVAEFIDFPTIRAGVEHLVSRWYQDWQGHKGVNRASTIEEAARLLEVEGYATDSAYDTKLLRILSERPKPPALATAHQQPPRPSVPHLRLTRTRRQYRQGLEGLRLGLWRDGREVAHQLVVSGAPGAQRFRTGAQSQAGSLEPLPEGHWSLGPVEWSGGAGNWAKSWGEALGPVWITVDYMGPGKTARRDIGIHLDWNGRTAPGTAGCIGVTSRAEMEVIIRWMNEAKPRHLLVDWGLGTCPAAAMLR